jgi:hypothetical protein
MAEPGQTLVNTGAGKIATPFVIWTLQRTGGTNFNGFLNRASAHAKFQDEPFNLPREHGSVTAAWNADKDVDKLAAEIDAICAQKKNMKHCVEKVPNAVNRALATSATKFGYAPIFLVRRELLPRVLSKEYAERTKSWGPSTVLEEGQDDFAFGRPLDVERLAAQEAEAIETLTKAWRFLRKMEAAPIVVSFEELYNSDVAVAVAAFNRVLKRLGVAPDADTIAEMVEAVRSGGDQQTRDRYARFEGIDTLRERLAEIELPAFIASGPQA